MTTPSPTPPATDPPDQAARRAYWTGQLDQAAAFMAKVAGHPLAECGEGLASIPQAVAAGKVQVAFSAAPLAPGMERMFLLRAGLIEPLLSAAREMNRRGWVLKFEDGFRTRAMQKALARKQGVFDVILRRVVWECQGKRPPLDLLTRRVAALIAPCPSMGTHTSGSAVDISVLRAHDGREIDRGGPYLELSELTPMNSPFVSAQARANRAEITAMMARHGFAAYPWEFWHYNQGDAFAEFLAGSGRPGRYGPVDCDPATGQVRAMAHPETPLNSPAEIQAEIEKALAPGRQGGRQA